MKVLHINAAEYGSTGKIISNISDYVYSRGGTSVLCAPKITKESTPSLKKYQVSMPYEQGIYRRISYLTGIPYGFAPVSTLKIFKTIKKEKPDVVHLHSINGKVVNIYKLLKFLKKRNIPTLVTNHAEFLYTGSCSYSEECTKWQSGCGKCPMLKKSTGSKFFDRTHTAWTKMKNAFSDFDRLTIVSVSDWVKDRSASSPILCNYENVTVLNGVDTNVFNLPDDYFKTNRDHKIILHVTSFFSDDVQSIKGGAFLIELAKRFIGENVKFVVAGPHGVNGELPENITLLGPISDQAKLAELYRIADLTVLTSKRETFGMAVAESMCCGTPVVGFKCGGSESISISEHSQFVEFGNVDLLEEIVKGRWLNYKESGNMFKISNDAIVKYSGERMAFEYFDLYLKLLGEKQAK